MTSQFTDRYILMCRGNPLPEFREHEPKIGDWYISVLPNSKALCVVQTPSPPHPSLGDTFHVPACWLPLDCDLWALIDDIPVELHRCAGYSWVKAKTYKMQSEFECQDRLEALLSFVMLLRGWRWDDLVGEWGKEGV